MARVCGENFPEPRARGHVSDAAVAPGESAVMLFTELHLDLETTAVRRRDNLPRFQIGVGESLSALDATDTNVRAKVEVCRKFSLSDSDFKRSAAGLSH